MHFVQLDQSIQFICKCQLVRKSTFVCIINTLCREKANVSLLRLNLKDINLSLSLNVDIYIVISSTSHLMCWIYPPPSVRYSMHRKADPYSLHFYCPGCVCVAQPSDRFSGGAEWWQLMDEGNLEASRSSTPIRSTCTAKGNSFLLPLSAKYLVYSC